MPYGLTDIELQKLTNAFTANPRIEQAILYGSRAKGTFKPFSDVDITLVGTDLSRLDLNHLLTAIDDLLLPYRFDVSLFHTLKNEELIEHINRIGKVIYRKKVEWKEYKIEDIVLKIVSGGTPKSSETRFYGGNIPWLNTKEINFNRITSTEKFITEDGLSNSSAKWIPKHSVIIAMYGATAAKVAYTLIDLTTNQACCNLIINPKIADSLFVFYYLQSAYTELENLACGAAQQNLSVGVIANFPIYLPPLEEQRRIASILSSLDDKIDLLNRENTTLEAMAETLFRKWFIEDAKEDWKETALSFIAKFLNGLACQKYPPKNDIDKLPVLKIRELTNGIGEDADWATTDIASEYIVQSGDVIFAWSASLMVKIWSGSDCILNQHLFKVSSDKYPKWFYYLWCKHHLEEFIAIAASHATTMGHIKRGDLDEAMVLVPTDEELQTMSNDMIPIFSKIENNNSQLTSLRVLRDILLERLMQS